jgi:hypothetical protein
LDDGRIAVLGARSAPKKQREPARAHLTGYQGQSPWLVRTERLSLTCALIVCFVGTQLSGTLFASEEARSANDSSPSEAVAADALEPRAPTSARVAASTVIGHELAATSWSFESPSGEASRVTGNIADLAASGAIDLAQQDPHRTFDLPPVQSRAVSGQIYQGAPIPMRRRHDGSIAALMVGALASITGAAILVYANRPECSTNQLASGCGYGTKVVGGAVLSGGVVGLFIAALTWRY